VATRLGDPASSVAANALRHHLAGLNDPGLYAWWVEGEARATLSARFGVPLPPLIYAEEAGATSRPSDAEGAATLWSRLLWVRGKIPRRKGRGPRCE
jgi:hypothetical protein